MRYGVKADLFLSGFTTRRILEIDPGLIDTIKKQIGKSFELGTYTYTHPIPQLLKPREFEKQIQKGLEIDQEVFGIKPEGFLPPEFAYGREMMNILHQEGIKWVVVLANLLKRSLPHAAERELYFSYTAVSNHTALTVVPAVYQLPETPQRFFKLLMKGELPVETVIDGARKFAGANPDALLLFKRDAETIFIDRFNSGFTETEEVFEEFLKRLTGLPGVRFVTLEQFIKKNPPRRKVTLEEYLGNTKIETFTQGQAKPIWELTLQVREKLLKAEQAYPSSEAVEKAWEYLLLSHNSDGRIGYWYSEWNPGEHVVARSRRQFI